MRLQALSLGCLLLVACGGVSDSPSATASPSSTPQTAIATPAPTAAPTLAPTPTPDVAPMGVVLPNPVVTPGEAFPGVTVAQICTPGYSSSVRSVTVSEKRAAYAEYGLPYPEPSGTYEADHLIPLELGGDNALTNLWPEPASPPPGFHQKDALENRLHELVCAGRLDLHQGQQAIAANWYAAYRTYVAAG